MSTHSKPSPGLRSLLSLRRMQGEREGTQEALESLREPLERLQGNQRKSLVRTRGLLVCTTDAKATARERAIAEMIEDDRFNTEET